MLHKFASIISKPIHSNIALVNTVDIRAQALLIPAGSLLWVAFTTAHRSKRDRLYSEMR